jgi:hypothetical protein
MAVFPTICVTRARRSWNSGRVVMSSGRPASNSARLSIPVMSEVSTGRVMDETIRRSWSSVSGGRVRPWDSVVKCRDPFADVTWLKPVGVMVASARV